MGHRRSEETKLEPKQVIPSSEDSNPFLSNNDITILTMATPFLSASGQKLISFFTAFNQSPAPAPDFNGILNMLNTSNSNNPLRELLPIILGLAGNADQRNFDPSLVKSLFEIFKTNKGTNNKESEE
ncbi:MAG: hypothetical protein GXY86_03200 [Firmicutes bacterium]|nr:hypothetical protein [Bacillota bacterium]